MKNNYGNWISLAEDYLRTSKLIMNETIKYENKWVVVSDSSISLEEYEERTKWSDFNTLIPAIFLLLHGYELLLKGVCLKSGIDIKTNHKLDYMIRNLENMNIIDKEFITLLKKYVGDSPSNVLINNFLDINNNITAKDIHVNIRYPITKKNNDETDFSMLKYKQGDLVRELETMVSDNTNIFQLALDFIRS